MKAADVQANRELMLKLLAQSQYSLARSGRTYSTAEVRRRARAALARARSR